MVHAANVALGNTCVVFIFDEIRYELNSVEIDRNKNVSITSTLKNYVTVSSDRSVMLAELRRLLRADTLISVYRSTCSTVGILRRLQMCGDQCSS